MELSYFISRIWIIVTTVIPARIVVYSITDIIVLDRVFGITAIVRLVACTRHPDNAIKPIVTDFINHWLEIIVKRLCIVLIVRILNIHRLICQFYANLTGMLFHKGLLRNNIPNIYQILLIIIVYFQITRTHSWRTNHDI